MTRIMPSVIEDGYGTKEVDAGYAVALASDVSEDRTKGGGVAVYKGKLGRPFILRDFLGSSQYMC